MEDWSREDLVNEINWLRDVSDRRFKRSQEMRNHIQYLEQTARARLDTIGIMTKEINRLRESLEKTQR
jgi:hypothetical protein